MGKTSLLAGSLALGWALTACAPPEPIRIGLLAGLSDRGSDFGESVRNGVILAVEQQNEAGGINGRKIELIVRDDGQDKAKAELAARELIALHPDIIIGPVTSSMATVVIPLMDKAGQIMISPTVASTNFYGKDDNFFRVNCTTREAAIQHARVLYERGARRAGLAFDASNLPFSATWVEAFSAEFEKLGVAPARPPDSSRPAAPASRMSSPACSQRNPMPSYWWPARSIPRAWPSKRGDRPPACRSARPNGRPRPKR